MYTNQLVCGGVRCAFGMCVRDSCRRHAPRNDPWSAYAKMMRIIVHRFVIIIMCKMYGIGRSARNSLLIKCTVHWLAAPLKTGSIVMLYNLITLESAINAVAETHWQNYAYLRRSRTQWRLEWWWCVVGSVASPFDRGWCWVLVIAHRTANGQWKCNGRFACDYNTACRKYELTRWTNYPLRSPLIIQWSISKSPSFVKFFFLLYEALGGFLNARRTRISSSVLAV